MDYHASNFSVWPVDERHRWSRKPGRLYRNGRQAAHPSTSSAIKESNRASRSDDVGAIGQFKILRGLQPAREGPP